MVILGAVAAATPIGELAPQQVAQTVGVVEKTLLEDLLVQARSVEAGGQAQLDVGAQRLVVGRCQDAVWIEALVKHQALEERLVR